MATILPALAGVCTMWQAQARRQAFIDPVPLPPLSSLSHSLRRTVLILLRQTLHGVCFSSWGSRYASVCPCPHHTNTHIYTHTRSIRSLLARAQPPIAPHFSVSGCLVGGSGGILAPAGLSRFWQQQGPGRGDRVLLGANGAGAVRFLPGRGCRGAGR